MDTRPHMGNRDKSLLNKPGLWASVAGALSGGPKDFALLVHSPLGKSLPSPSELMRIW